MKVSIWIPDNLLEKIDEKCFELRMTRSAFLVSKALDLGEIGELYKVKYDKTVTPETIKEVQKSKDIKVCKHGRMVGLCEHGCK
jgi:hypothetical protein